MEHLIYSPAVAYVVFFSILFVSAMAIPVGSEIATLTAGALASGELHPGPHLSLPVVIIVGTVAEVAGSGAGYAIGRYGGRTIVDRWGKYILLTHKDLDRADAWFARRGDLTVLIGRFIPLVRSFVSLVAGIGEMTVWKFFTFTAIASAIWVSAMASIGYALGSSIHHVLKGFSYAGIVAGVIVILIIAVGIVHRVVTSRSERRSAAEGQAVTSNEP